MWGDISYQETCIGPNSGAEDVLVTVPRNEIVRKRALTWGRLYLTDVIAVTSTARGGTKLNAAVDSRF